MKPIRIWSVQTAFTYAVKNGFSYRQSMNRTTSEQSHINLPIELPPICRWICPGAVNRTTNQ
jgi:hypothetical protein